MKRAMSIAVLAILMPVGAAAQEPATPSTPADGGNPAAAAAPIAVQRGASPKSTKRRGSMVGYIENAAVGTQLRIRFDGGWGVDSPDRAEFFYAKCGCYRGLATAAPALFDAAAPGPGPGIVTNLNFQQFDVMAEFGVGGRFSVFGELPVQSIKPRAFLPNTGSFGNTSGIGDVKVGVKLGLVSDDTRSVTVLLRASLPTGDALKGLGTDHKSIEPALLYRQQVSDRVSIESQLGDWHPVGGSRGPLATDGKFAGDIIYYGIGPSVDVVRTDKVRFTPVVEIVGWHVVKGFETKTLFTSLAGNAKGVNIVNLKLGARTTVANGGSFYAGFGWGLTNAIWYDKLVRVEYRAGF
jgi:hypothetical protein